MQEHEQTDPLTRLVAAEKRYAVEAYRFLFEALDRAQQLVGARRHVSGRELMEGLRALALERFGPLALMVFRAWGTTKSDDFGRMVFALVEHGLMGKTDDDRMEDFVDVFDLEEAFDPALAMQALDPRQLEPVGRSGRAALAAGGTRATTGVPQS